MMALTRNASPLRRVIAGAKTAAIIAGAIIAGAGIAGVALIAVDILVLAFSWIVMWGIAGLILLAALVCSLRSGSCL